MAYKKAEGTAERWRKIWRERWLRDSREVAEGMAREMAERWRKVWRERWRLDGSRGGGRYGDTDW